MLQDRDALSPAMALGSMSRDGSLGRGSSVGETDIRSKTPPSTPTKVKGKLLGVKVLMLDDSVTLFQVQVTWLYIIVCLYCPMYWPSLTR